MGEKFKKYSDLEIQEVEAEKYRNFQAIVENPESARILGAIIGRMGPNERKKFYPLVKELVGRVDMRAVEKGLAYWEKKKGKKK